MLKHRVIPALLLRNGGLVKTRKYRDPKYVGDPTNAIRIFNEKEVDELMVLDIEASRNGREPDYDVIGLFASECFMPLCYGGGIRTFDQAQRIFGMGVEKLCLQSAALADLKLVEQLARHYGSQSVLVSVDVKRDWLRRAKLYESAKQSTSSRPWMEFLKSAVDAGAGEVLLSAVDRDGEMNGYDLELISQASELVDVPIVALGGAGSLQDFRAATDAGAAAVAAGAYFVFQGPHRAVLISYPKYQDLEALFSR